jgi:hypothetical protein
MAELLLAQNKVIAVLNGGAKACFKTQSGHAS